MRIPHEGHRAGRSIVAILVYNQRGAILAHAPYVEKLPIHGRSGPGITVKMLQRRSAIFARVTVSEISVGITDAARLDSALGHRKRIRAYSRS